MPINTAERLIGDIDAFIGEFYGRLPRVHRAEDVEWVRELLPLDEVDLLLSSPALRPPYLEISRAAHAVRERAWTRPAESRFVSVFDSADVDSVATEFSKGSTLILNDLDDYNPRIKALCDDFHALFLAETKSVVFITPPGHQGLGLHFDTFEGFIVQTHGAKKWYVYERTLPLSVHSRGLRPTDVGEPILETRLEAGDCLYIPWGSPHRAESEDALSCHITLMPIPRSWPGLMRQLLRQAIPDSAYDAVPALGHGDPDDLAREATRQLRGLIEQADRTDLAAFIKDQVIGDVPVQPGRAGFLEQHRRRSELTLDSRVARNHAVEMAVRAVDGHLEITVGARRLRMPLAAEAAIAAMDTAEAEALRDLAPALSERSLLQLAGHLVATGVLRVEQRPGYEQMLGHTSLGTR